MKKIFITLVACSLITLMGVSNSDAFILFERPPEDRSTVGVARADSFTGIWTYAFGDSSGANVLFSYSTADSGSQLVIDSGAAFDGFSALLTNGIDDRISVFETFNGNFERRSGSLLESQWFSSNIYQENGIDFQGIEIESFVLDLDLVSLDGSPSDFVDFSGNSYVNANREVHLNFSINAKDSEVDEQTNAVPEPATMLLLGGGLLGSVWRKRKKV